MDSLQQKIQFEVDASKVTGNSLGKLLAELRTLDAAVDSIYSKLSRGPMIGGQWLQSLDQIKKRLEGSIKMKGPYPAQDLFKALGFDDASMNQALARLKTFERELTGFQSKTQRFTSLKQGALGIERVMKAEVGEIQKAIAGAQGQIGKALRGQGGGGAIFSGKDFKVTVEGEIPLVIPGKQIRAVVEGPVTVTGATAAGGGGPRDPVTGQFAAGAGGGGGKRRKPGEGLAGRTFGEMASDQQAGELSRTVTETERGKTLAVRRIDELNQVVSEVYDSVDNLIRTSTRTTVGNSPLAEFRSRRGVIQKRFQAAKAGLDVNDPGHGLASLYAKQASELRGLSAGGLKGVPEPTAQLIRAQLSAAAATLEAKGLAITQSIYAPGQLLASSLQRHGAGSMSSNLDWLNFFQGSKGEGVPISVERGMPADVAARLRSSYIRAESASVKQAAAAARKAVPSNFGGWQDQPVAIPGHVPSRNDRRNAEAGFSGINAAAHEQWLRENYTPEELRGLQNGWGRPWSKNIPGTQRKPPMLPQPKLPAAKPNKIQQALNLGWSPTNFAAHVIKFSGWAAAITAIYKPLELAEHSMERLLDVGEKTAHLAIVFRGVGGSARQLADDVMKTAAAYGQSTDEALESAAEWARLGLTRVQVNEAVRVSLMAANVAEISAGEATKQMSSLVHIYGLNVGQLDAALGMMVNTSQKFNVTVGDLFGGLDRAAAAAKVAGVSFAELQGLIGATSGGIGQSGIQIGNTIKNLLVQFTRPEMQEYLKSQGISTVKGSQFGSGSEVIRQMFIRYQSMSDTQRRSMGTVLMGRLQVARFEGLMKEYPMAQKLAIDGQLRLNAAMEASVLVTQTLRSQIKGLGSEWDRLVVNLGNQKEATEWTRFGKNVLGAGNNLMASAQGAPAKNAWRIGKTFMDVGHLNFVKAFYDAAGTYGLNKANAYLEGGQPGSDEQFQKSFGIHMGRMESFSLMARLFRTAAAVGGAHTEAAEKTREFADDYLKQLGGRPGDYASGQHLANRQAVQENIGAMTDLATRKDALDKAFASGAMDNEKYTAGLKGIAAATQQVSSAMDDELSTITEMYARKQEYINLLKEQQSVMEALGRVNSQIAAPTMTGRTAQRLQTLDQSIPDIQDRIQQLRDSTGLGQEIESLPQFQELQRQLESARAERAALGSPRYQALMQSFDDRAVAAGRAKTEGESYAVGYTESEKLLRQQGSLQHELSGLDQRRAAGTATDNDVVRAMQLEVQLAQTHEKIQQRIVELKGQEKQILIDAVREYQKALLLAGPGELLKRLYAGTRGNMSTGQFMSLDPEARRYYFDLHGGEAGLKNREEQHLLRNQGLTVEGEQAQSRADRAAFNRWQKALPNPVAGMPGLKTPPEDPVMTQAYKSAAALSEFSHKLLTETIPALDLLKETIARLPGGGGPTRSAPSAPAPRLDVSGGHALGSRPPMPMSPGADTPDPNPAFNGWRHAHVGVAAPDGWTELPSE